MYKILFMYSVRPTRSMISGEAYIFKPINTFYFLLSLSNVHLNMPQRVHLNMPPRVYIRPSSLSNDPRNQNQRSEVRDTRFTREDRPSSYRENPSNYRDQDRHARDQPSSRQDQPSRYQDRPDNRGNSSHPRAEQDTRNDWNDNRSYDRHSSQQEQPDDADYFFFEEQHLHLRRQDEAGPRRQTSAPSPAMSRPAPGPPPFEPGQALTKPIVISPDGVVARAYANVARGTTPANTTMSLVVPQLLMTQPRYVSIHENVMQYFRSLMHAAQESPIIPDPYFEFPQMNEMAWKKAQQRKLQIFANGEVARSKKNLTSSSPNTPLNTPDPTPVKKKQSKKLPILTPVEEDDLPELEQEPPSKKRRVLNKVEEESQESLLKTFENTMFTNMADTYLNTVFQLNMLATPDVWFIALGQFYGISIKPMVTHQARVAATDVLINHTAKHMQTHKDGPPHDKILELVCAINMRSTPIPPVLVIPTPVPIVSPTVASGTKSQPQRSTSKSAKKEKATTSREAMPLRLPPSPQGPPMPPDEQLLTKRVGKKPDKNA